MNNDSSIRVFTAELFTETNTFSPIPTGMEDFHITRPADLESGSDDLDGDAIFKQWLEKAHDRNDRLIFGLSAYAQPAGVTSQSTYESLREQILDSLQVNRPVDVVLLSLHGAMVAQSYDDCEGDLLQHIRKIVGSNVIIAVELDLHCHLTEAMLDHADLLITYKEYPHIDVAARGNELYALAIDAHRGKCRPTMALFECKMVGMYPTSMPAMRDFINTMKAYEKKDSVLSVSFIHGFPFGDVAEAGGKILVITDDDLPLAEHLAEDLGQQIVSKRHIISFDPLPLEEAFESALSIISMNLQAGHKPIVIADQSDNAGCGAPSDSTFALRWLLEQQVQNVALAIFYDPQVVKLAISAGEGAEILVRLGGKMCAASGDPVDLRVLVKAVKKDYFHAFHQESGDSSLIPIGDTVALQSAGIHIIVSSGRCQCFDPSIFDDFGICAKEQQLLIVKSAQHFFSAFAPIASEVIYMAAPGAVPPIMQKIPYQRMSTVDKFPWIDNPFASHM